MTGEEEQHVYALDIYLNLGHKRSYRQLAKLTDIPKSTLARWSKEFGWTDRARDFDARNPAPQEKQEALDTLVVQAPPPAPVDSAVRTSPEYKALEHTLRELQRVIDTGFETVQGKKKPTFEIKSVKDYVSLLQATRDTIELMREVAPSPDGKLPGSKGSGGHTTIEKMLVMLGDADAEIQRGFITAGSGSAPTGGAGGTPLPSQEADTQEVPYTDAAED